MQWVIVLLMGYMAQPYAEVESYADRQALRQIERDIERVSSSGIGDAQSNRMQVEALMRQQEAIYSKYGARLSDRTNVNITIEHRPQR